MNVSEADRQAAREIAAIYVSKDRLGSEIDAAAEIIARHMAAEREKLARFKAKDQCLPSGYAIGDDASAALAVELVAERERTERLEKALRGILDEMVHGQNVPSLYALAEARAALEGK